MNGEMKWVTIKLIRRVITVYICLTLIEWRFRMMGYSKPEALYMANRRVRWILTTGGSR